MGILVSYLFDEAGFLPFKENTEPKRLFFLLGYSRMTGS
jgi:hypothetical protein